MSTAWESDTRPTQPCVVCFQPPDRMVELPELSDVHFAFASSALCGACAEVALAGDVVGLRERAVAGWPDDLEAVPDLTRLVMTWAGHHIPAGPVAPDPYRHVELPPLSADEQTLWCRLEQLMFDGPAHRVSVHGWIAYSVEDETSALEVFRDGDRSRLVGEDGLPWVISDGVTTWRPDDEGMVASPYDGESWAGQDTELAARRTRADVEAFGFGTPIGPFEPVTRLGRSAWSFRFAAPSHKPFDMTVVVDDETGLVLEQRFGDHSVARWTTFDTGVPMPDELFTWDGATRTVADLQAERWREHEHDMAQRAAWFTSNVTSRPLQLAGTPAEINLHDWDEDGSFEASFDAERISGSLARRPRDESWWNLSWSNISAKWSDDTWDWALSIWDDHVHDSQPTEDHIRVLRQWLATRPDH